MFVRVILVTWVILALTGCALTPGLPAPYDLDEPFLSAWRRAGGETLGPPQTPPLWIDEYQVQLFGKHRITAVDPRRAVVEALEEGWSTGYPTLLRDAPAAVQRASVLLGEGAESLAGPLAPLKVTVRAPGYNGPATLHLFDAAVQPAGQVSLELAEGYAHVTIDPRGAPGPHWAVVLIDGQVAGARSALFTLHPTTALETGDPELDALYPQLRGFMERAVVSYELNGRVIRGYRSPDNPLIWLRDHVYQGRGFRYFETDVTSVLDAFREAQLPDGSLPDVLDYPERMVKAHRKEVESDLEFLYVQGVYEAWQMTGDDEWLRGHVESMRRALNYITSDPLRWDAQRQLVRRPYTIDMWDFAYGPTTISPDGKPAPRHWIEPDTIWGTFHGDNTGVAHAMLLMAHVEEHIGDPQMAPVWRSASKGLMDRLNDLSWNGRFFTHFIPEDPTFAPAGVDPTTQLSLSNAYALNRLGVDGYQGQRIIEEYFNRRDFARAFAEWYSIDPPFPAGSFGMAGGKGENPGEYTNGGIKPLVGGELARGAFRHGFAAYGLDILRRYADLTELTGSTYLWYYPDGRPGIQGPDTIANDGWGAGAMIGALFEGLAGFDDQAERYRDVILSPRWASDPSLTEVRAVAAYAASDTYLAYRWQREDRAIHLDITGGSERIYARILLPPELDAATLQVTLNGGIVPTTIEGFAHDRYIAVPLDVSNAQLAITW